MQTLTVEITNSDAMQALHDLENKHFIRIINKPGLNAVSLPGEALSLKEFESWINDAENAVTIDLKEAKSIWANKRKKLQSLTR